MESLAPGNEDGESDHVYIHVLYNPLFGYLMSTKWRLSQIGVPQIIEVMDDQVLKAIGFGIPHFKKPPPSETVVLQRFGRYLAACSFPLYRWVDMG